MTLTCFHSPHHYSSSMKSFLFPPHPRRSLLLFSSVLCCKSSSASSCSVFHFCLEYLQHQSFCFNTVIFLIYFKRCNIFCSCACLMSLIGEKVQQSSTHLFGFCFFYQTCRDTAVNLVFLLLLPCSEMCNVLLLLRNITEKNKTITFLTVICRCIPPRVS